MEDRYAIAARIAARLVERGETVAVAESSAGGLISAALLAVPGASRYFLGGSVIYTHEARRILLAVPETAMQGLRSSTEPYALLLARTIRERLQSTFGLSETGAAGPTGNPYGDSPGHACVALAGPVERAFTLETGSADRAANMERFATEALSRLEEALVR